MPVKHALLYGNHIPRSTGFSIAVYCAAAVRCRQVIELAVFYVQIRELIVPLVGQEDAAALESVGSTLRKRRMPVDGQVIQNQVMVLGCVIDSSSKPGNRFGTRVAVAVDGHAVNNRSSGDVKVAALHVEAAAVYGLAGTYNPFMGIIRRQGHGAASHIEAAAICRCRTALDQAAFHGQRAVVVYAAAEPCMPVFNRAIRERMASAFLLFRHRKGAFIINRAAHAAVRVSTIHLAVKDCAAGKCEFGSGAYVYSAAICRIGRRAFHGGRIIHYGSMAVYDYAVFGNNRAFFQQDCAAVSRCGTVKNPHGSEVCGHARCNIGFNVDSASAFS